jgi:hypothetical protein
MDGIDFEMSAEEMAGRVMEEYETVDTMVKDNIDNDGDSKAFIHLLDTRARLCKMLYEFGGRKMLELLKTVNCTTELGQ